MSRGDRFTDYDLATRMRELVGDITSGRFADEWDAERDAGYPVLESLRAKNVSPEVLAFEADIRTKLGEGAASG
jgi:ketol-acid reductoisomerase